MTALPVTHLWSRSEPLRKPKTATRSPYFLILHDQVIQHVINTAAHSKAIGYLCTYHCQRISAVTCYGLALGNWHKLRTWVTVLPFLHTPTCVCYVRAAYGRYVNGSSAANALPANKELAHTQKMGIGAKSASEEEEVESAPNHLFYVATGITKRHFSARGLLCRKQWKYGSAKCWCAFWLRCASWCLGDILRICEWKPCVLAQVLLQGTKSVIFLQLNHNCSLFLKYFHV